VLPTTINANARITMDPSEMTDAEIVAELSLRHELLTELLKKRAAAEQSARRLKG
jgi:hypothetical protein